MTCGSVSSQEKNKVKAGDPGRSEKVERMGVETLNNKRQE